MLAARPRAEGVYGTPTIAPNLAPGAAVLFAHGLNVHFGRIVPPAGHDVIMVAPKAPGHRVRELYVVGRRHAGRSSRCTRTRAGTRLDARARVRRPAIGCGRVGLLETTFAEETESDLFGEQAVLCGGVTAAVQAGFETLVEAGYQPEIAYYECLNELKLIVDLIYEGGLEYMRYSISDIAEYGDLTRGPRVVDDRVARRMKTILEEIRSGAFAKELFADDDAGRPGFEELRAPGRPSGRSEIEQVGKELRELAGNEGLLGAKRRRVSAVDVRVALLGYGTVGAAVHRLLDESGDEIERATGPPAAASSGRSSAIPPSERGVRGRPTAS